MPAKGLAGLPSASERDVAAEHETLDELDVDFGAAVSSEGDDCHGQPPVKRHRTENH